MSHERSDRGIRWSWIIWGCLALGLGAIAWLQICVNRFNGAQQIAYVTAANRQIALSKAAQSTVFHYEDTHNFGDPRKPTLEQFLKDCNCGRPLGADAIWQDPATGGKVRIFDIGDGTFTAMLDTDFSPPAPARYSNALWSLRNILEPLFCLTWIVLCALGPFAVKNGPRRNRIALATWLVCLSFSTASLGFLGTRSEMGFRKWGLVFLTISGLYLAGTIVFRHDIDPTPRCAKCRYNLTANASGICPECGTPVVMAI